MAKAVPNLALSRYGGPMGPDYIEETLIHLKGLTDPEKASQMRLGLNMKRFKDVSTRVGTLAETIRLSVSQAELKQLGTAGEAEAALEALTERVRRIHSKANKASVRNVLIQLFVEAGIDSKALESKNRK